MTRVDLICLLRVTQLVDYKDTVDGINRLIQVLRCDYAICNLVLMYSPHGWMDVWRDGWRDG